MQVALDQNRIQKLPQVTTERRTNRWPFWKKEAEMKMLLQFKKKKNMNQKKLKSTLKNEEGK